MQNEQTPSLKDKPESEKKQETIKELANRHLADKNHTTTEEELRNARIVLDEHIEVEDKSLLEVDNTTVIPPLLGEVSDTTENKKDDDSSGDKDNSKAVPNPYDVLR